MLQKLLLSIILYRFVKYTVHIATSQPQTRIPVIRILCHTPTQKLYKTVKCRMFLLTRFTNTKLKKCWVCSSLFSLTPLNTVQFNSLPPEFPFSTQTPNKWKKFNYIVCVYVMLCLLSLTFVLTRGNALRQGSSWRGSRGLLALLLVALCASTVAAWLYLASLDGDITETLASQREMILPQPRVYSVQCSEDYENYKRYPGDALGSTETSLPHLIS